MSITLITKSSSWVATIRRAVGREEGVVGEQERLPVREVARPREAPQDLGPRGHLSSRLLSRVGDQHGAGQHGRVRARAKRGQRGHVLRPRSRA